MATVINNPSPEGDRGTSGLTVALIILIVLFVLFLIFGRSLLFKGSTSSNQPTSPTLNVPGNINVNTNGNY